MSILQRIKDDLLIARKAAKTIERALLTTVFSEIQMIGKNDGGRDTTDAETIAYLKKMVSNLIDFHNRTPDALKKAELWIEIDILNGYLPTQLNETVCEKIVNDLKADGKTLPEIMKYFKENHAGLYDGAFVSKVARG